MSASIGGLQPCTPYHFRIVVSNPDGGLSGADSSFTTTFANPLANVTVPNKVKHKKKFTVKFSLSFTASVKIFVKKGSHTVNSAHLGTLSPGEHSKKLKAPKKKGKYTVQVVAEESCGKQLVNNTIKVT